MALLLIRHGETDLNATRVVQHPHTPLGANGLRQAEQLGHGLRDRNIRLVLTSDYARARTTAEHVARHLGVTPVESVRLRERNFGDLRGRAYDELGHVDLFGADYVPPNGESWPVFHRRVDEAWAEIVGHAGRISGDIAVVTHGLVLRSLFERVLDTADHVIEEDLVVANTSVTVVDHAPPWRVQELASVAHLDTGPGEVAPV
ncbi:MAG: histidine phosphatase family protein [Gammaproteobacteria bacterium]